MKRYFKYINPILALALLSMVLHIGIYHAHDVVGQVQHAQTDNNLSDQIADHASGDNHDHNDKKSAPVKADATHCVAGLIHLSTGDIIQPMSNDIVVVEYVYAQQDHFKTGPTRFGLYGRAPPVELT